MRYGAVSQAWHGYCLDKQNRYKLHKLRTELAKIHVRGKDADRVIHYLEVDESEGGNY